MSSARLDDVTGLVLAGGQSHRFGSDKSRYRLNGVELRQRAAMILLEVVPRVLLSVADNRAEKPEGRGDVLLDEPAHPFVQCVPDVFPGLGPLGGLHAGLQASGTTWTLVVPCDMPDLQASTLRALVRTAQTTDADAVVAACDDQMTAVVGCYRSILASSIENRLREVDARLSMESFVRSLGRWSVVGITPASARNINRREDAT